VGYSKPSIDEFLLPIVKELVELELGILIEKAWFKFFLLFVVADKPARALLLNMKLASSFYGCLKCEIKGVSVPYGRGTHVIFKDEKKEATIRNKINYKANLDSSLKFSKEYKGIKGNCLLNKLKYFCPVVSCNIDLMHSIYLGVCKMLFFYWFSASATSTYSLKLKLIELNNKIGKMRPPGYVQQAPRKLDDYNKWRSHEFMNFFLFFAIPLFRDIMPNNYFQHLLLLIIPLEKLVSKNINRSELPVIDEMLNKFVTDAETLYDIHFYTSGVHELLHLVACTIEIGPMNDTCCYQFEELNRKVTRFIKGQDLVGDEFIKSWTISKNLGLHIFNYYLEDDDDNSFVVYIKSHFKIRSSNLKKKRETVGNFLKFGRIIKIDKDKLAIILEKISELLNKDLDLIETEISFVVNIKLNNILYNTIENKTKFSNFVICYNNNFGLIEKIFKLDENVYFFVRRLLFLNCSTFNNFFVHMQSKFCFYSITRSFFLIKESEIAATKKHFMFQLENNICLLTTFTSNHLFS